jgi:hypothetical protein
VLVYLGVSALVLIAASGHEQDLVLFYAVAVFVSFLAGLAAMARFSLRDHRPGPVNIAGAIAVTFTLLVNLTRGYPLMSIAATVIIAAVLYALWARAGRPAGIEEAERHLDDPADTQGIRRTAKPSFPGLRQTASIAARPDAGAAPAMRVSAVGRLEMAHDLAGVVQLPGFAWILGPVLLVEADEQVDQLAANGPAAQQVRQLRQLDQPLRIPRGPVIIGPVDDPEDTVVSLACLMKQTADLLQCVRHLIPPPFGSRMPAVAGRDAAVLA